MVFRVSIAEMKKWYILSRRSKVICGKNFETIRHLSFRKLSFLSFYLSGDGRCCFLLFINVTWTTWSLRTTSLLRDLLLHLFTLLWQLYILIISLLHWINSAQSLSIFIFMIHCHLGLVIQLNSTKYFLYKT